MGERPLKPERVKLDAAIISPEYLEAIKTDRETLLAERDEARAALLAAHDAHAAAVAELRATHAETNLRWAADLSAAYGERNELRDALERMRETAGKYVKLLFDNEAALASAREEREADRAAIRALADALDRRFWAEDDPPHYIKREHELRHTCANCGEIREPGEPPHGPCENMFGDCTASNALALPAVARARAEEEKHGS